MHNRMLREVVILLPDLESEGEVQALISNRLPFLNDAVNSNGLSSSFKSFSFFCDKMCQKVVSTKDASDTYFKSVLKDIFKLTREECCYNLSGHSTAGEF